MAGSVQVYVNMGTWNYEWDTNQTDYDGLTDALGVVYKRGNSEDTNSKDFLRGVNNLKPPELSIVYGTSKDGAVAGGETTTNRLGVCTRRCSPAVAEKVLKGDSGLVNNDIKVARRGKATATYKILSVRVK